MKISPKELRAILKGYQTKRTLSCIVMWSSLLFVIASVFLFHTSIALFVTCLCVGILLLAIGGFCQAMYKSEILHFISSTLVRSALESVFDDVEYILYDGISEGTIRSSGMERLLDFNAVEGRHFVRASYRGMRIEFSYIELFQVANPFHEESGAHNRRQRIFHGIWLICDPVKKELAKHLPTKCKNARIHTDQTGKVHAALTKAIPLFEADHKLDAEQLYNRFVFELGLITDLIDELAIAESAV